MDGEYRDIVRGGRDPGDQVVGKAAPVLPPDLAFHRRDRAHVSVGRRLAQRDTSRKHRVGSQASNDPDQHGLPLFGYEPSRAQSRCQILGQVVATGLPFDGLAPCREEVPLPRDKRIEFGPADAEISRPGDEASGLANDPEQRAVLPDRDAGPFGVCHPAHLLVVSAQQNLVIDHTDDCTAPLGSTVSSSTAYPAISAVLG